MTGIDRGGKTPLVRELVEVGKKLEYDIVPIRVKQPPTSLAEPWLVAFNEIHQIWPQAKKKILVYDRFPLPDELVYRRVVTKDLDPEWNGVCAGAMQMLLPFFRWFDVRIIYVDPPVEIHKRRLAEEADPYITLDMFDELKIRYAPVLDSIEEYKIPVIRVHDEWFNSNTTYEVLKRSIA